MELRLLKKILYQPFFVLEHREIFHSVAGLSEIRPKSNLNAHAEKRRNYTFFRSFPVFSVRLDICKIYLYI